MDRHACLETGARQLLNQAATKLGWSGRALHRGVYVVAEGDYPTLVAGKLNTTVDALEEANADTDGYGAFYVGLTINVPC